MDVVDERMLCVYLQTFEAALFWKKKKNAMDGSVMHGAVSTEETLEVLVPTCVQS